MGEGEKPGYLDGLTKQFFLDVPYSHALTRSEQILREDVRGNSLAGQEIRELKDIKGGQKHSDHIATQTLQEAQATRREVTDLLKGNILSNLQVDGRLERLHEAVETGMQEIGESIQRTGSEIIGIPTHRKNIDELISGGSIDEDEAFVLAARGVLDRKQGEKVLENMAPWKTDIIRSGLVTNPQPKLEKTLSNEEKLFLARLRRKMSAPTAHLKSLEPAARHGLLDKEAHHELAKQIRIVRFGTEGINYGMRELNDQTDVLVTQGEQSLRNDQAALSQREISIRLTRAGIFQGERQIDLAGKSLTVQTQAAQELSNIRTLGERAEVHREIIIGKTDQIARNTEFLAAIATRAADQGEHYGELQSKQMTEAQIARLETVELTRAMVGIGRGTNVLLNDIRGGMVYYGEKSLERLEGIESGVNILTVQGAEQIAHLSNLGAGMDILREIGLAQLETKVQANQILEQLREDAERQHLNVVNVIEAVRTSIYDVEARRIAREFNRDQINADEAYREAIELMSMGEIDEAIDCFTKSQKRWSLDYRAYYQRGLCHVRKKDPRSAEADFKKAIRRTNKEGQEKTNAIMWLSLARLHYGEAKVHFKNGTSDLHEEKLIEAIEAAQQAVDKAPDYLEAPFALATYLSAFKLWSEALEILIDVILKDPKFAVKMDQFDVLTPLRDSLKNSLGEDFNDEGSDIKDRARISIARDCIQIGDYSTALKSLNNLINENIFFLIETKFWEMDEFTMISGKVKELLEEEINNSNQRESEHWYALTTISLHLGLSNATIYKSFYKGAIKDPDFKNRDIQQIESKLEKIDGEKKGSLLSIIRWKRPIDFPWLFNN